MHISTIGPKQWVDYLMGDRYHSLILTSWTLSKIYYLKLGLISYCNFLLIWLRQKNIMWILPNGISADFSKYPSEAPTLQTWTFVFLLPLGCGACRLPYIWVYLQYRGYTYKSTYMMNSMYAIWWCHNLVLLTIESGNHTLAVRAQIILSSITLHKRMFFLLNIVSDSARLDVTIYPIISGPTIKCIIFNYVASCCLYINFKSSIMQVSCLILCMNIYIIWKYII